jgi:hypothetical protein
MPHRIFGRADLGLEACGCYIWCARSACEVRPFQRYKKFDWYDGNAVLDVLNVFAHDKPDPTLAFTVGELMLAGMCDVPRTQGQVLAWLNARWDESSPMLPAPSLAP